MMMMINNKTNYDDLVTSPGKKVGCTNPEHMNKKINYSNNTS